MHNHGNMGLMLSQKYAWGNQCTDSEGHEAVTLKQDDVLTPGSQLAGTQPPGGRADTSHLPSLSAPAQITIYVLTVFMSSNTDFPSKALNNCRTPLNRTKHQ